MVHRMRAGREIFVLLLVVVFVGFHVVTGDSAAADKGLASQPSSSSYYTSMRALDKFGNAVPLKHAREAALRHGRLVVAATAKMSHATKDNADDDPEERIVVVSVGHRKLLSSLTLPLALTTISTNNNNNNDQYLHSHSESPPPLMTPKVAMCCTGVRSDADWLTRQMQAYVAKVWERYDMHPMSTGALAHWLARLLGRYQQPSSTAEDDDDDEWQSAISRRGASMISSRMSRTRQEQEFESALSRPLGVQTCLLSTSMSGSHGGAGSPSLLLIEPTGRVFRADTTSSFSFVTMGKQSDKMKEALLKCTPPPPPPRTTEEESSWLEDILTREILNLLAPSKNEIVELLVECLGPSETKATLLRYQSGNLMSRTILE